MSNVDSRFLKFCWKKKKRSGLDRLSGETSMRLFSDAKRSSKFRFMPSAEILGFKPEHSRYSFIDSILHDEIAVHSRADTPMFRKGKKIHLHGKQFHVTKRLNSKISERVVHAFVQKPYIDYLRSLSRKR